MSRSMTVAVPSPRRILVSLLLVIGAAVLVIAGIRIGDALLGPSPIMSIASGGGLQQVRIVGGTTYLGIVLSDEGGALRLSRPAVVREEVAPAASGAASESRIVVQSLATDPFGIAADIIIPLDQVALVGEVAPTSSLAAAYGQAMGTIPAPTSDPSP